MGSDNLFYKHREERKVRKENILKQQSAKWLMVCEGTQTEPNYFQEAVALINQHIENQHIDDKYKLKVKIVGKGKNTVSLVKSAQNIIDSVDQYKTSIVPYGKIFIVFDKDSFSRESFNEAVELCKQKGYIPLWSNQAIEYWFLLYFNYVDSKMDRSSYKKKLNEFFKQAGLKEEYQKNDKRIFSKLFEYGSLENAIKNANKVFLKHKDNSPSDSESCTTVFWFFKEVKERLKELE